MHLNSSQKEAVQLKFDELKDSFDNADDLSAEIWDQHLSFDDLNFNLDVPANDDGDLDMLYWNLVKAHVELLWNGENS